MGYRVGIEVHYLQNPWPGSSHWLVCDVPSSLGCTCESEFVSCVGISNHFKQCGNF